MAYQQSGVERLVQARGKTSAPSVMWRLLVFALVVFFMVMAAYVGMEFGYRAILNRQITSLEQETGDLITGFSVRDREEMLSFYSRLANIRSLLDTHIYSSQLLELLEKRTVSGVYYEKASFIIEEGEGRLDGVARSYLDLAREIEALRTVAGFSEINLESAGAIAGGERVAFVITLKVDERVMVKNQNQ